MVTENESSIIRVEPMPVKLQTPRPFPNCTKLKIFSELEPKLKISSVRKLILLQLERITNGSPPGDISKKK